MFTWKKAVVVLAGVLLVGAGVVATQPDEPTEADLERWTAEYMTVVKQGRDLWTSPELGTNGVACAQCHPNGANTHPETYPKFQQQIGKVVALRDMVNWCIQNPVEGQPMALDDPRMVAIESYLAWERRGVALAPGKH